MADWMQWVPEGGLERFMFDVLWQSTLIAAGAMLAIRSLQRRPEARSMIAVLACSFCIVTPLLTAFVRGNGLGLLAPKASWTVADSAEGMSSESAFALAPESELLSEPSYSAVGLPEEPAADSFQSVVVTPTEEHRSVWTFSEFAAHVDIKMLLLAVWVVAAAFLSIRLMLSAMVILRIWRESRVCDDSVLMRSCRRAARLLKIRNVPPVFTSNRATCPAVISWFRVRLIVPTGDLKRSEEDWVSVFAHELAHVQRRDGWAQLVTELAFVLLPWQPLIWILRREFATASEEACDDWAVYSGANPVDYASTLTDWIPRKQTSLALGFAGWPRIIRRRIERLLEDRDPEKPALGTASAVLTISCVVVLVAVLAFAQPGRVFSAPVESGDLGANSDVEEVRKSDTKAGPKSVAAKQTVLKTLGDGRLAHWNTARIAGFHADSETLISISDDRTLVRWELATGKLRRRLSLPAPAKGSWRDWPEDVRAKFATDEIVTPDGRFMVESMANGDIRVVDIAAGTHRTLEYRVVLPRKLALSHDGATLAVLCLSTDAEDRIDLINVRTGKLVQSVTRSFNHQDDDIRNDRWRGFALNHDGSRLATGRWEQITVWNTVSGDEIWNVRAEADAPNSGNAGVLSFSLDGQQLACGERIRNAGDGELVAEFPLLGGTVLAATRSAANIAKLNPTNSHLAVINGRTLRMIEVGNLGELWRWESPSGDYFNSLKFDAAGKTVTVGCGHEIQIIDVTTGQPCGPDVDRVRSLAVNPVEAQLLLGKTSGAIQTVNTETFQTTHTAEAHQWPVEEIVFCGDGSSAASAAADSVFLHDSVSLSSKRVLKNSGPVIRPRGPGRTPLAFSSDGFQLYVLPRQPDRTRKLLTCVSTRTGEQLLPLQMSDQIFPFFGLTTAGKDELVISSPQHRGSVSVWNSETGEHIADLSRALPKYGGRVRIAASRDGNLVACGMRAELIRLHNRSAGTFVDLKKGHRPGMLHSLAFHPEESVIASAAEDGRITLWNTTSGKETLRIKAGPNAGIIRDLAWNFDGTQLIALNANGTVSVHGVSHIDF